MPPWNDIVSTAEAAAMLRVHPDHVSRLCREGKVDCHRLRLRPGDDRASIWLVSRSSLRAYLETDQRWTRRRFIDRPAHETWVGPTTAAENGSAITGNDDEQPVEPAVTPPA